MTTFPDAYMFAPGFDNPNAMQVFPQQPTSPYGTIDFAQLEDTTNGEFVQNFPASKIVFTPAISPDIFNTTNTFLGLDPINGISSVDGTFRIRIDANTFANCNATIKYARDRKRGLGRWESTEYDLAIVVFL